MKDLEEAKQLAFRQIVHISQNGCSQFKCKDCVMNKMCDHIAVNSKETALRLVMMARSKNA